MIDKIIADLDVLSGDAYLWKATDLLLAVEAWADSQHENITAELARGSESIYITYVDDAKDEKLETRISLHPNGRGYYQNHVVKNYNEYWETVKFVVEQFIKKEGSR